MRRLLFVSLQLLIFSNVSSQIIYSSNPTEAKGFLSNLRNEIEDASTSDKLLTPTGLNIFLQKKVINYLTGSSDLSLAKIYAAYTGDNDRLSLGINIPYPYKNSQRISVVFNPILEADLKNNFAKLYEDGNWKNNIRGGFKVTFLPSKGKIKYIASARKELTYIRNKKFKELSEKYKQDNTAAALPKSLDDQTIAVDGAGAAISETKPTERLSKAKRKKLGREIYAELGNAEVDYLEKYGAYTKSRNYWFSIWGFTPLTRTEQFTALNSSQPFEAQRFSLWEINVQGNYLKESRKVGTILFNAWVKYFQNNSANATLMTEVTRGEYFQMPNIDTLNLSLLKSSKAYLGSYEEFKTTTLNLQAVYFAPLYNTLVKPGLSIRYEKNWGDYDPTNLRFGLPLTIQGKDKPINIELQYRINDVDNFNKVADHKTSKSFGISVGLPFALLYK